MKGTDDLVVDAVITWVDGNDPGHREKLSQYISDKNSLSNKSIRMRYDQVNEIEFAVKSILKYATFVRNIFIVTDNQIPDFLKDKEKAKKEYPTVLIVDHKIIFEGYDKYLPTFNSRTIETQLSKIPNLAEHFIYFNDDLFLLRETKIGDFFKNNFPVLRGSWKKFNEDIFIKKVKLFFQSNAKSKRAGHKLTQEKSAKLVGYNRYFKFHHTPHPFRKSTIENFFSKNENIRTENINYKFRNSNQFTPQGLANHLELKNKTCSLVKDYRIVYYQNYKKPFWWLKYKLRKAERDQNKLFLCMQSLDQCPGEKQKFVKNWLHDKYD
jgi:hypothetical protein